MAEKSLILIVDDDPSLRQVTGRALENAGYLTLQAVNGREALEMIRRHRPALVLMDVNMPEMDGFSALRAVKADPETANTYVVIVSGSRVDADSTVHGLETGADGYITRPISNRELVARVQSMLRIKAAEDALREKERELRDLIASNIDGMLVTSLDGTALFANPAACELLHRTAETVIGQQIGIPLASGQAVELELLLPDGTRRVVELRRREIEWQGQPAYLAALRDLTERKQAEDRLRSSEQRFAITFQSIPDALAITTLEDGKIIDVNRNFSLIFGYSREEVLGKTTLELGLWANPADRETFVRYYREHQRVENLELQLRRKSGQVFTGAVSGESLSLPEGFCTLNIIRDVTENKQAREELRAANERYRTVADYTYNWEYWRALDGHLLYISPSCERISGYTVQEFLDNPALLDEIVHPEDREVVALHLQMREHPYEAKAHQVDFRILHRDGSTRWIGHVCQPVMSADGQALGIRASNMDITDRMRIEAELRETRDYLENLVTYANAPIIVWNDAYQITLFNQAFERLTGLTRREVLGQRIDILFPPEKRQASLDLIYAASAGQRWETVEIEILHTSGETHTVLWNSAPIFSPDGKAVLATIAQGQDISERKRAEEALRQRNRVLAALQQTSLDLLAQLDLNTLLENIILRANELIGTDSGFVDLVDPESGGLLPQIGIGALVESTKFQVKPGEGLAGVVWQTGKPLVVEDYDAWPGRIAAFSKNSLYSLAGVPLIAGGKVIGVLGLGHSCQSRKRFDPEALEWMGEFARLAAIAIENARLYAKAQRELAARTQAEREVQEFNASLERRVAERTHQLQASNRELEAFAYSVSHDLRAPLRGIDGWSLALLEDYSDALDEQGRNYLKRVRGEAQRMGQLIDDLLQLSRVTRLEMQYEPIDLSRLARQIAARLKENYQPRTISISVARGLTVRGDSRLLEVVLYNLLDNACKFTSRQEKAEIVFGKKEVNGQSVFYVRDNGVGFDMAIAQNLFGPFQRLHKVSDFPGNGIGLATVQRILQRHGGRIWAEAEKDRGAVFYFTIED